jgi:RNA polymerase sigma factor (sigma-70 family)
MDVEVGGAQVAPADLTRITLVSHVRVHAEAVTDRLRDVQRLTNVTLARVEDCTPSQLQRRGPDLLLVDSSSVPIATFVNALGVAGSVMLAQAALKLVAYGLAEGDEASILEFASLGTMGFVLCDATFEQLAQTVLDVLGGKYRCPPSVTGVLLRHYGASATIRARLDVLSDLTPREREALILAVAEQEYKQIAARMGITESTVKAELHRAYRKLGVTGSRDAARLIRFSVTKDGGKEASTSAAQPELD